MNINYQIYLRTDYWHQVSQLVKDRAGHRCQICNSKQELHAHHRTYANKGNELEHLDDLTCLCRVCHGIFHGRILPDPEGRPVLVEITRQNHKRLKMGPVSWRWMKDKGINPRLRGWSKRAIGHFAPAYFLA